jgi:hypothetical protein
MFNSSRYAMNTSATTSLYQTQLTSFGNNNSTYLANMPACTPPNSSANFLLPGSATHDTLVDNTTCCKTHMFAMLTPYKPSFQTSPTMAPLNCGFHLHVTKHTGNKQIGTEWIKRQQATSIYLYGYHPLLGGNGILDHKYQWYIQSIQRKYSTLLMETNSQ